MSLKTKNCPILGFLLIKGGSASRLANEIRPPKLEAESVKRQPWRSQAETTGPVGAQQRHNRSYVGEAGQGEASPAHGQLEEDRAPERRPTKTPLSLILFSIKKADKPRTHQ